MRDKKRPKIGLALGAGGARGLAHIGVIETFISNRIEIDYIAGTSMGAIVGGVYAATKDIDEIKKEAVNTNWKKLLSFVDPDFRGGVVEGEKIKNYIEKYVKNLKFSDLKIPFSAVATDLNTGEAVVLNSGKLSEAIKASMSIPLVFKPVVINDMVLVDGALAMPVPADVVRKMGADIVIAVNLDANYFTERLDYDTLSFQKIIKRSINILSHNLSSCNIRRADVVLSPKVGGIKWNEFSVGEEAIEEGRKEAYKNINNIKKLIELY